MISIDRDDQSKQIIDEYLTLSHFLVDKREADGRIQYGYAVACLILCAIDAIGHRVQGPHKSKSTRFDILEKIISPNDMEDNTIQDILDFYRNGLVHAGLMAQDVFITALEDKPFHYKEKRLYKICLPKLLNLVEIYWDKVKDEKSLSAIKADTRKPAMNWTAEAPAASGCVTVPPAFSESSTLTPASSGFIMNPRKP